MTERLAPLAVVLCLASGVGCGSAQFVDPASVRRLPPVEVPASLPDRAYERFVALGDWGTGNDDQQRVADAMATWARANGLTFLLTVGDNFYPAGVESVDDEQWDEAFEQVYDDAALFVPVYASLGNHDYKGDPDAQVAYGQSHPRWIMPARYYDFVRTLADGTTAHFFAIDSTPIERGWSDAEAQVAWLEAALTASRASWKIVFGHHPLEGTPGRGVRALEPLLARHEVDLYLAGHDHVLELMQPRDGVHHLTSGGGAGPDLHHEARWTSETIYAATGGGFVAVRIGRDELVIEFVRLDGRTQFVHVIDRAVPAAAKPTGD